MLPLDYDSKPANNAVYQFQSQAIQDWHVDYFTTAQERKCQASIARPSNDCRDHQYVHFETPLEPDGKWSHWFKVGTSLQKAANATAGDTVTLTIHPVKEWPEPDVPIDLQHALAVDSQARELWQRITPMARWEWIRWIRATSKNETRKRRIEVACSKLASGERRPCCWNRNSCTEPHVSKNGVLLEPTQSAK